MRLELDNRPENVILVREMLAGVAESLAITAEQLDDIKTAVSEACNNVVLHAYGGELGPLEVSVYVAGTGLEVVVRDRGGGIKAGPPSSERVQGIGLAVIQALTDRAEFRGAAGEGTEVRMEFSGEHEGTLPLDASPGEESPEELTIPTGDAIVSIAPTALLAGVLGRLTGALAARARFSLDRLSDAQLVSDALAAHAPAAAAGPRLGFGISTAERRIDLSLGPLRRGSSDRMATDTPVAGLEPLLPKLTDELNAEPVGNAEMLHLALVDSR